MPLKGGAADKWGNRFEGRWTVRQLIEVMTGRAEWLWLEPPGDAGEGCEFVLRRSSGDEHHQVKRQHADTGRWTIGRLKTKGVLDHLLGKLASDAAARSVFVSMDAVEGLRELSERAAAAQDAALFADEFAGTSGSIKAHYANFLEKAGIASDDIAWDRLRRLEMTAISEGFLKHTVELVLDSLLGSDGANALAVLGDYLLERTHQKVLPEAVWAHLAERGFRRTDWGRDPHLAQNAHEATDSYIGSLDDRGFDGQFVARSEAGDVMELLRGGTERVWVKGVAGVGKSEVVRQLVDAIREEPEWSVLGLRVDGLAAGTGIQEQLKLLGPPVEMLEHIARERDSVAVLLIDQLDAVSSLSGRRVELFEPVRRLMQLAAHAPHVRVVVVCRAFDLQADERLQALPDKDADGAVEVGRLEDDEVGSVLLKAAPKSPPPSAALLTLLSLPLHLRLYLECLTMGDAPTAATTRMHLFDRYWTLKQQRIADWSAILEAMTTRLDADRRLDCPWRVVESWPTSPSMVSEHVLVRQGRRVRFFHQTFFDYAWTLSSGVLDAGLLACGRVNPHWPHRDRLKWPHPHCTMWSPGIGPVGSTSQVVCRGTSAA